MLNNVRTTFTGFSLFWVSILFANTESITETVATHPLRWQVTDHLLLLNSRENAVEESVGKFLHEDTLHVEKGAYSGSINFTNSLQSRNSPEESRPFSLEKKTVAAKFQHWKVVAGDRSLELGRGIALALYQDPAFGIHNTLEGASVQFAPQGVTSEVFAGRINALTTPVSIYSFPTSATDSTHWLAGGSLQGEIGPSTRLSGHYLFAQRNPEDRDADKRWHTVGSSLNQENIFENADLYLETNILTSQRLGLVNQSLPTGFGSYGALTWVPSDWKWKLEAKDYRKYNWEFRRAPTLEEDIVVTLNTEDVSAARLQSERRWENMSLSASYLVGEDRNVFATIHHPVIGMKYAFATRQEIEWKAGMRILAGNSNLAHGSVKTKLPIYKAQLLEIGVRKQYSNLNLDSEAHWEDRNFLDVGYRINENWGLSTGYEWVPSNEEDDGRHFFHVAGNYRAGSLTARAMLGQTNGGTLCSGGICRRVPPFSGAMVETTYLF